MSTTEYQAMMTDHLDALWPTTWRATTFPHTAQPFLVLSHPDPSRPRPDGQPSWISSWHRMPSHLGAAIQRTLQQSTRFNEYYGVNLGCADCKPDPYHRLKSKDIVIIPGFLGDFDGAWGDHRNAEGGLPETFDALLYFLHTLPSPPTRIVDTGGGVHTYHLFHEPWILATPEDRTAFLDVAIRFQETVEEWARERHGWTKTSIFTSDLDRVLRLPGTISHKYGTVVTTVEDTGNRYAPSDLLAWLPARRNPTPRRSTDGTVTSSGSLDVVALAEHYGVTRAKKSETELAGSHPVHGSDTGTNLNINPDQQLWHCHRHTTGGDALMFLAMCEGILTCEHAKPGGLRGGAYVKAVRLANTKFHAGIVLEVDRLDDAQADVESQRCPAAPQRPNVEPPTPDPTDPELAPKLAHHVLPAYLAKHPDPQVRKYWQRVYRRTALLKTQLHQQGALA